MGCLSWSNSGKSKGFSDSKIKLVTSETEMEEVEADVLSEHSEENDIPKNAKGKSSSN